MEVSNDDIGRTALVRFRDTGIEQVMILEFPCGPGEYALVFSFTTTSMLSVDYPDQILLLGDIVRPPEYEPFDYV